MEDTSPQPENAPDVSRPRWQVGMRTLLIVMAVVAVWTAYFINRRHNAVLEERIKAMVPLAHELVIDDPKKIAVVRREAHWFDENVWDFYLPEGRFRLCLATRQVNYEALAPAVTSHPIAPGQHVIAIDQKRHNGGWRVTVTADGRAVMTADEIKSWDQKHGSSGGGEFDRSAQPATDKPVVLLRRRFSREVPGSNGGEFRSPEGPAEGLLLWVEQEGGPAATP